MSILRALIVDDDEFDRETCRRVLESMDWQVVEATTPEEALSRMNGGAAFKVIISDYDLKTVQTGLDVLTEARERWPGVRRVLMSGLMPPKILRQATDSDMVQAYIEKPDSLEDWRMAVQGALPSRDESTNATGSPDADGGLSREDALEQRVRWLNAVVELGAEAHRGASLQETFDRAVVVVSDMLEMEYTKILELQPGGKEVLLVAGVGWRPGLVGNALVSTGMDSQAGYTLASEHPVVAEDLRAETRFSGPSLLHEHGVISGLSVVIPGEAGRPWGVFGAHTKERRRLTDDHALFLRAVANVVAGAIARARTEETLRNTKAVLEREVTERTRELGAAVDDLQAFNAMAAHDLRAPLRTLSNAVDLFLLDHGKDLDPKGRGLIETMKMASDQMRHLLEDLLALARATQDPLQMKDVDVTSLALERWERVRDRQEDRDVRFVVEEDLTAHADPNLLSVVLDNLLSNALKFTRYVADPEVKVGAEHLPVGGTALYVRDNGAGFDPEQAGQLFHPFKRLHKAKDFEGTGIGLTTVRRIIERHHGSVRAESAGPGKGATVYFRLLPAGLP